MPDFITANLGAMITLGLAIIAAIAGYATLRYKVVQNCKKVAKIDDKLHDMNEEKIPYCMTFEDHDKICGSVNQTILKRLDKMDKLREDAKKNRDEQLAKMVETLGYIKGRIDARWPSET